MDLISTLTRVSEIERVIYANGGELDPITEKELEIAQKDLQDSLEAVAFAYKKKQIELEYLKNAMKDAIYREKTGLEKFKNLILFAAKRASTPLKTPLCSINVQRRSYESVLILDFDFVANACPDAVTILVEDNVKTITLNKTILKKRHKEQAIPGLEIKITETEFPVVRMKGMETTKRVTNAITNEENE